MSSSRSLTPLDASQYDAIEDAVRETERGRWFLAEYARRNRNADTEVLLDAIHRIENAVTAERPDDLGRFRGDLMEMADAIARTRSEVAALSTPDQGESRLTVASETLDAIVRATERATSDILGAAEEVQEAAWTLRETGADSALCDALDRHATQIYTACSFQDLTAQRTSRVVHTLRYLENRITSMIGIWGSSEETASAPDGDGRVRAETGPVLDAALDQSDVDRFLDMESAAPAPARPSRPPLPAVMLDDDLAFLPEMPELAAPAPAPEAIPAEEALVAESSVEESALEESAVEAFPVAAPLAALPGGSAAAAVESRAVLTPVEPEAARGVELTLAPVATLDHPEPAASEAAREETAYEETAKAAKAALPAGDDLAAAFPDLDTLSIEEKIALFA